MKKVAKKREPHIPKEVPIEQESTLAHLLQWVIAPLILAITGFLFYRSSLHYAFQFDDIANITKFYNIRHATFQSLFFGHSRWVSSWLNAANYRMGAADPFAPYYFRLTNIGIHIITSLMIFFVFFLLLRNLKQNSSQHYFFKSNAFLISFFTSFLFLLHPAQTQAVSYVIQGRLEGVMCFTIASMALFFVAYCLTNNSALKAVSVAFLCIAAAFSCGTKEAAIVGPALLLLLDWFFIAQGELKSLYKRVWIHALVGGVVAFLFLYYLKPQLFIDILSFRREMQNNIGNTITEHRNDAIKPLHYMISEFKVILHYLWIYLWPFNISVDYDWKMVSSFWAPDCILPFLLLVGIGSGIAYSLRKNSTNLFAFGLLWFFVSIAPRASIAASTELIADYKTYLSSIGWLFVIASALIYVVQKLLPYLTMPTVPTPYKTPAHIAALVLISLPVGIATHQRNKVWRSGEEFWANVLQNAPGRARAYNNYGVALSEKGQYADAIPYFKKAATMDAIYPDPLNNLAVAHSTLGNMDEAIMALKQSLKINPYYPEAYNNLGSFFLQKEQLDEAEQFLKVALQLRPHYGKAYYNLARVYTTRANKTSDVKQKSQLMEQSWQFHKNSCTIADFDNNLAGLNEWAKVSFQLHKYDDAVVALKKMLTINPDLPEALFALGNAYFFMKDFENARVSYYHMTQKFPQDARIWNNLGESCFLLGQFEESVQCFNKTLALNPNLFNTRLRMAEALSRVGKDDEAKKTLEFLLVHEGIPESIKSGARLGLSQLKAQQNNGAAKNV